MKRIIYPILTLFLCSLIVGCSSKLSKESTIGKALLQSNKTVSSKVRTTEEFISELEKLGYEFKTTQKDNTGLLFGNLTTIAIKDETIGLYEYENNKNMELNAQNISSDGSTIGNSIYEWVNEPHFYKNGNLIVSYIGNKVEIADLLESLMGKQFAGRK